MTTVTVAETPLLTYCLRHADNALVLGHRLSEWTGKAPMLEAELALANLGLDLIGQARSLYTLAGEVEGAGRDEDALAYRRDVGGFRNVLLVERPNGDFAHTMARQLLFAAFMHPLWQKLAGSGEPRLAAIAAKAEKEMAYHVRHSSEWVIRLGDGTAASRARAQAAVEALWPYTGELFEADAAERTLIAAGVAVDPTDVRPAWEATLGEVLAEATLTRPADGWMQTGGRTGRHTEHFGHLLAELQFLPRAYPDARW
jgi:ring-1,2-phenylacetyl-CoA epoxidase subunit PaaC